MRYRLLGPLEVCDGDRPVRFGEGRQRNVLILLLLHRNEAMGSDRLIDALWGESPPATAAKVLQNYIGQLRRALDDRAGRRLQTRGRGYAIHVEDGELDLDRFERLVREGGEALALDRPADAAGAAARGAGAVARAGAGRRRRTSRSRRPRSPGSRSGARWRWSGASTPIWRSAATPIWSAELEALVGQHPLRERLRGQLMLALYRCGRQAEALEAFREARRLLVEEIGVEPGPELRALHEAILRQDAALELRAPRAARRAACRRRGGARRARPRAGVAACALGTARAGAGELVVVSGPVGIGKTRLAAELAAEVHRAGGAVLYASGWQRPEAVLAVRGRAREATRPTLLVVDDADAQRWRARCGRRAGAPAVAARRCSWLATAKRHDALAAARRRRRARAAAARRRRRAGHRGAAMRRATPSRTSPSRSCSRRAAAFPAGA